MKVAGYYHFQAQTPEILVVAPVPLGDMDQGIEFSERSRRKSQLLPGIFEETARRFGCAFFDAGSVIRELGCDNIHFTPEDHRLLARALEPLVRKLTG